MKNCILLALFLSFCRFLLAANSITGTDSVIPKIAVGAIRWDAWIGDVGRQEMVGAAHVGLQVERALSPNRYHYRAPFFSKEISYDSIQCRGLTQAIMDQEIAYAKDAGIDYWAFCWYPFGSGLDSARTLYLQSKHAKDVKWCVILGTNSINMDKDGPWLVDQFKKNNYQKVQEGRPLVYIYEKAELAMVDKLRALCKQKRLPAPYFAVMAFTAEAASGMAATLQADAISAYKSPVGKNGEPYYPVIPKGDSTGWEKYQSTGRSLIPWVTTGRNLKPRIENAVAWQKVPADQWVADGTPEQIADNIKAALQWTRSHQQTCPASAIVMYAWNEFDEGGWICPTFGNNTSRLEAIKKVLTTNK